MKSEYIGIVVGAVPISNERAKLLQLIKENNGKSFVIAADGGIKFFLDEKIAPDLWIGDMDSSTNELIEKVDREFSNLASRTCSPIKDDTDLAIALKIIFEEMKYDKAIVFGGIGGVRFDHSIANIQLMHHYKACGMNVEMYGSNVKMEVLMDEEVHYGEGEEGYISVFSLTDEVNIDISGLFYEYTGTLKNTYALGVSNEFCNRKASISVKNGTALIVRTL